MASARAPATAARAAKSTRSAHVAEFTIALSHPLREQLADVVQGLPSFSVVNASAVTNNAKNWKSASAFETFEQHLDQTLQPNSLSSWLQAKLGIVNLRRFRTDADLVFANGGFLITNKPYVIYIEKATQVFGYFGSVQRTWLAKRMLNWFIARDNLALILFRTETARKGFLATYADQPKIVEALARKSTWLYPPDINPAPINLARFAKPKTIKFLFIHSSFIIRGGYQLVRAFDRLAKEHHTVELTIITKRATIDEESAKIIEANPRITLHEAAFERNELYTKFFNTHHCYVQPTFDDSFSMQINEAISAGLPVISSDYFAIPERVKTGVSGFLFKAPYKNYDASFVFAYEHFTDKGAFAHKIYDDCRNGTLQYVTDFLYDRMGRIASDAQLRLSMAAQTSQIYAERLARCKDKRAVDHLFRKALLDDIDFRSRN